MNNWIFLAVFVILVSCKSKKDKEEKSLVSVVTLIEGQVKKIDTSLYRITVIQKVDSTADTTIIPREDFRKIAKDFLTLPDISSEKMKYDYEESNTIDRDIDKNTELGLFTYTATNADLEIRRQTLMFEPSATGDDTKVRTILVNSVRADKDSTIEKDMIWHMDNRFQVVSKIRKPKQPEKIRILQVRWE